MAFRSLLDPDFKYRSAATTDVRETFERVRRELLLEEERRCKENAGRGAKEETGSVIGFPPGLADRRARSAKRC